jgi:hypothetical protein
MSDATQEPDEAADPEPDEGDLEAGSDFVGDYPEPNPAIPDTASEGV